MKTFESLFDYFKFVALVKNTNRYLFHPWGQKFLEVLLLTSETRQSTIPKDTFFWRSQLGAAKLSDIEREEGVYTDDTPYPYLADRMKPRIGLAPEGRTNPKGIPCLYLSTDQDTAMAEQRPRLQSHISLGRFQAVRDLTLIDCSKDVYMPVPLDHLGREESDPDFVEKVIWGQINDAFTEPVTPSDETADYVATQVIAEFFKSKNYEGLKYKSHLGEGYNVALFDLNVAELTHCYLFRATKIAYSFESVEGAYYATPLGKHIDNPTAAENFIKNIKKTLP